MRGGREIRNNQADTNDRHKEVGDGADRGEEVVDEGKMGTASRLSPQIGTGYIPMRL